MLRHKFSLLYLMCFMLVFSQQVSGAVGDISTVAGGGTNDGGSVVEAGIEGPWNLFVDSSDNIHVADWQANRIFKLNTTTGIASHVVGDGRAIYDGDGLPGKQMSVISPVGVSADSDGNTHFNFNGQLRKVDASGNVTTIIDGGGPLRFFIDGSNNIYYQSGRGVNKRDAVTGATIVLVRDADKFTGDRASDGRLAVEVEVGNVGNLFVDGSGHLYIADDVSQKVWKVDATTGIINAIAGNGSRGFSGEGGAATEAALNRPRGVYVDAQGHVYIGDAFNRRIRKVDAATGIITTIAGGNAAGERGLRRGNDIDGALGTEAALGPAQGVGMASNGDLYFTDRGNGGRIWRLDSAGIMHHVGGNFIGDGGLATAASVKPNRVFAGSDGSIYIADNNNLRVRKVDPSGNISTIAGNGSNVLVGDNGPAVQAGLNSPNGVFVDASGVVYIHDGNRIRKVDTSGNISTVAGNLEATSLGDGGLATSAQIDGIEVFVDGAGHIYFTDRGSVRKIDNATGVVTTVAGGLESGFSGDGGLAIHAQFSFLSDIFIDENGNLFIVDNGNQRVRKVDATTGIVTTVAGNGSRGRDGDGGLATDAKLGNPRGIFVDSVGNLFIAGQHEGTSNDVRKVDTSGIITTVAGNGNRKFLGDGGPATETSLWTPRDVAIGTNGDLFIADFTSARVRKVEGVGAPTTLNPGVYMGPTVPELVTTQAGSNVEVTLPDPGANTPAISLTFGNVSSGGVTNVVPVAEGPPPPQGLRLGEETVYYDFNTTASFSGPVDLCFNYTGMNVGNEAELKLFHFVNNAWVDVTTSLDTQNNIVCGQASSFSFFALFVPLPSPPTPRHFAVVKATVTQGGTPLVGAKVAFSRSGSGVADAYLWEGSTDAEGKVRIEILIENIHLRRGASGYYSARVSNSAGSVLDVWHSVPVTGQEEVTLTLPIGESFVIDGSRQLNLSLSDNVPNPFNPSTTIAYQMPESGPVSLIIFNMLGQEVRSLVNTFQSAGQYRVVWDGKDALGSSVASGVYFYRLVGSGQVETKRMLLLK